MSMRNIWIQSENGRLKHHGRRSGDWFFSGPITGFDPVSGDMPSDPESQVRNCFHHLNQLLDAAGLSAESVGHLMVWQKDRAFRDPLNVQWANMFPMADDRPARHVVIRDWPGDSVIVIEATAIANCQRRTIVAMPGAALGGGSDRGFIPLAAVMGEVMFTGAIAGWNVQTGKEAEDPAAQTNFAFTNVQALLEIGGFDREHLVQAYCWQSQPVFAALAQANLAERFAPPARPAGRTVMLPLPMNLATQVETIALRASERRSYGAAPGGFANMVAADGVLFGSFQARDPGALFAEMKKGLTEAGFGLGDVDHLYVWKLSSDQDEAIEQAWADCFPDERQRPVRHDVLLQSDGPATVSLDLIARRNDR
ncbi:RidA family protein [Caulobacter sp. LARHSG274]